MDTTIKATANLKKGHIFLKKKGTYSFQRLIAFQISNLYTHIYIYIYIAPKKSQVYILLIDQIYCWS